MTDHPGRVTRQIPDDASHRLLQNASRDVPKVAPKKTASGGTEGGPTNPVTSGGGTEGGPKPVTTSGGGTEGGPPGTTSGGGTEGGPPGSTSGGGTEGGPPGGGTEGGPPKKNPPGDTPPIIPNPHFPIPTTTEVNSPANNPPIYPETTFIPPVITNPGVKPITIPDPIIPETEKLRTVVKVTPPPPDKPEKTTPPPTGVFTGDGKKGNHMQQKYYELYTSGNHSAHRGQESLTAPSIGLNHIVVDAVGTGTEEHHFTRSHSTDMVPPRDPHHLGEWKHEVPGKTIIAGHVEFGGTPGPLYNLRNLGVHNGKPDEVTLESASGKKDTFRFSGSEILKDPKDQKAWDRVFAPGDPNHKLLVLVTCCGPLISEDDIKKEPALKGSLGLHKWRRIDYLYERPTANSQINNGEIKDPKGEKSVEIKFENGIPTANVKSADQPQGQTVNNLQGVSGNQHADGTTVVQSVPDASKTTTTKLYAQPSDQLKGTSQHAIVSLTQSGNQTMLDATSKPINLHVGAVNGDPNYFGVGHTFVLKNTAKDQLTFEGIGGYSTGRSSSSTLFSANDKGFSLTGDLSYSHSLSRNTSLFGNVYSTYAPGSDYKTQLGTQLGLDYRVGRLSLYGGAGDYFSSGHGSSLKPFAGASYELNKNLSLYGGTDGQKPYVGIQWTIGKK